MLVLVIVASLLLMSACMMTAPGTEEEISVTPTAGTTEEVSPTVPGEDTTPTAAPTEEPTPEPTATETPEVIPTATPSPTETPVPTDTPKPTETPKPTDTPKPTKTPTATNTPKPTATPKPTETPGDVTPSVTPDSPTPVGTPTPQVTSAPTPKTSDGYPDVEGTKGILNEKEYLRPAVGRNQERTVQLPFKTKVVIVDQKKSEFNEIWYKVAVLLDGKVQYGYVQAAAVDLEKLQPTPKSSSLNKVGTGNLSMKHGSDRDGDGVYVVVLDPGHGGKFYGASHFGVTEKSINLKVAKACKDYLESTYDNVKVYLTRSEDKSLDAENDVDDLELRVRYAMGKKADILVSLHFDAFDGGVRGAEALITKGKLTDKSMALGSQILRELEGLGIKSLGCMKRRSTRSRYSYPDGDYMDGYLIIRLAAEAGIVPVIIENAHLDHEKDFKEFLNSDEKLKKIGQADARGIASYLGLKKKDASEKSPTPAEDPKLTGGAEPTGEAKPTGEAEPTGKAEPTGEAKPTGEAEPTGEAKPTGEGEPEAEPSPTGPPKS